MTPEQLEKRLRRAEKNICASKKYKVYTALLTQSGTNPPAATVFENTIGNIVWTRTSAGLYNGTLVGAFPAGTTFILIDNKEVSFTVAYRFSDDVVRIETLDTLAAGADDLLNPASLEIRVYKCEGTTTSTTTTTTEGV